MKIIKASLVVLCFITAISACHHEMHNKPMSKADSLKSIIIKNKEVSFSDISRQMDMTKLIQEIRTSDCLVEEHLGIEGRKNRI